MTEGIYTATSSTLLLSVHMNPETPAELEAVVVFTKKVQFATLKNRFGFFFRFILIHYSHMRLYWPHFVHLKVSVHCDIAAIFLRKETAVQAWWIRAL